MRPIARLKVALVLGMVRALRALGFPWRRTPSLGVGGPKSVLVVSTTGIGDTLWGVPAIRALRAAHPETRISVLTSQSGSELLRGLPYIDEIFVFRRRAWAYAMLPCLVMRLGARRFDAALVFHVSERVILPVVFLSGASAIVGFDADNKGLDEVLTRKIPYRRDLHAIDNRLSMVAALGATGGDYAMEIALGGAERDRARGLIEGLGFGGGDLLIGLHPGAKDRFKCWPEEHFVSLGRMLHEKLGARIIVTGNSKERALSQRIASNIPGGVSLAGPLSLRETAAVIERLGLFVTNDTGPMHMACAVGTPVVAVFSPTDPSLCGPRNCARARVISAPTTCDPCLMKRCTDPVCMAGISPEMVFNEALIAVGRRA